MLRLVVVSMLSWVPLVRTVAASAARMEGAASEESRELWPCLLRSLEVGMEDFCYSGLSITFCGSCTAFYVTFWTSVLSEKIWFLSSMLSAPEP